MVQLSIIHFHITKPRSFPLAADTVTIILAGSKNILYFPLKIASPICGMTPPSASLKIV
jgi:hypothetical protein